MPLEGRLAADYPRPTNARCRYYPVNPGESKVLLEGTQAGLGGREGRGTWVSDSSVPRGKGSREGSAHASADLPGWPV